MKNKKAFTLVELLAVIVVIGLLSMLIIPKVTNSINDAEKRTDISSAENLLNAATYKATNDGLDENIIVNYDTNENIEKLDYSGKKPEKGFISILKDGHVVMAVKIKNNCYLKRYSSNEIQIQQYDSETCNAPASFETDSWKTISNAVKSGETEMYKVGDTRKIAIDTTTIESPVVNTGSINRGPVYEYTLRLANKSTPEECNNDDFSQTACGFVIEFADVIARYNMNSNSNGGEHVDGHGNVGGWAACEMREYVNDKIYNLLPNDLKEVILDTKVISSYGLLDDHNFTTTDKLFLLDLIEIESENVYNIEDYDTLINHTRQLDYYEQQKIMYDGSIYSNIAPQRVMKGYYNGAEAFGMEYYAISYWLRTADLTIKNNFVYIKYDAGNSSIAYQSSTAPLGVAPAFRLG